jgi:hypothetical protein
MRSKWGGDGWFTVQAEGLGRVYPWEVLADTRETALEHAAATFPARDYTLTILDPETDDTHETIDALSPDLEGEGWKEARSLDLDAEGWEEEEEIREKTLCDACAGDIYRDKQLPIFTCVYDTNVHVCSTDCIAFLHTVWAPKRATLPVWALVAFCVCLLDLFLIG